MLFAEQAFYGAAPAILFVFISLAFSIATFLKKSFSTQGIIIGNLVGFLVFLKGGLEPFIGLAMFFLLGELATWFARRKVKEQHEMRTKQNVLGNTLAPLIGLFVANPAVFFGGISAALSDTLSSEIGLLSKSKPRLITNFSVVEPGTNGGITLLGSLAAVFGAAFAAFVFFAFYENFFLAALVFFGGLAGSTLDSLLGAVFENKGKLDKAQVNFFATLCGTIFVLAVMFLR